MTLRLRGDRVLLRPFREAEFDEMWERNLARGGSGDRERYVEFLRSTGGWQRDELLLAIEAEGRLVGDIQARRSRLAMPDGVTELGIALFDGWTGRGLGTEALRLLCRHLFEADGFHRVQLSTDVTNAAMRRSAEKAGFAFEGVLRGYWREGDEISDYAMYARTLADHEGGA
jgi:RimJ/RimL family protein N-acetyltransferase